LKFDFSQRGFVLHRIPQLLIFFHDPIVL
jgi:hypothetical protein